MNNLNMNVKPYKFKYDGQKFLLIETELGSNSGFRLKKDGIVCICINRRLPSRKRKLLFHRCVKNRNLENIDIGSCISVELQLYRGVMV